MEKFQKSELKDSMFANLLIDTSNVKKNINKGVSIDEKRVRKCVRPKGNGPFRES